jgi:hypothetical protein
MWNEALAYLPIISVLSIILFNYKIKGEATDGQGCSMWVIGILGAIFFLSEVFGNTLEYLLNILFYSFFAVVFFIVVISTIKFIAWWKLRDVSVNKLVSKYYGELFVIFKDYAFADNYNYHEIVALLKNFRSVTIAEMLKKRDVEKRRLSSARRRFVRMEGRAKVKKLKRSRGLIKSIKLEIEKIDIQLTACLIYLPEVREKFEVFLFENGGNSLDGTEVLKEMKGILDWEKFLKEYMKKKG